MEGDRAPVMTLAPRIGMTFLSSAGCKMVSAVCHQRQDGGCNDGSSMVSEISEIRSSFMNLARRLGRW